jgi:hypothetical protein
MPLTPQMSNQKCKRAYNLIYDKNTKQRVQKCKSSLEFGFALLLQFVKLEATLKILRYWENSKDVWPDRLNFLHGNWRPLRDLKLNDPSKYDILIGTKGKKLINTRNLVAHECHNLCKKEYDQLAETVEWALKELIIRLPPKHEVPKKVARFKGRKVIAKGNIKT